VTDALSAALPRLRLHRDGFAGRPLRRLFAEDPNRFRTLSATLDDLLLDYSKHRITAETMDLLVDLARLAGVEDARGRMFGGEAINTTERRAVLHVALRNRSDAPVLAGGRDVMGDVSEILERMRRFVGAVRSGALVGATGLPFTDVVNIGIGGSDLGPQMATLALAPYGRKGPRAHFVSNVDGAHIADTLRDLDPARTLVLVASKTFSTLETMTNAGTARAWIVGALGETAVSAHFAAISTALDKVAAFGIDEARVFGFWDWVGGRYSVWSAIGLPVALSIGFENFEAFLAGGHDMDRHFVETPLGQNLPVIMALLGIWYRDVWGCASHAVLPYDQHLARFPAHLQQLDMESNGKSVRLDGTPAPYETGPVVWGEPGTNGQHAFFQLLHQGTDVIPADFLVAANDHDGLLDHQQKLVANCFAQSEALMRGRTADEALAQMLAAGTAPEEARRLAPHRAFPGDRPSSTLIYSRLDPRTLGRLLALYEHKVFVQGVIWGINSFDQWGVELGKELATELLPMVRGEPGRAKDASTMGLLAAYRGRAGQ